VLQDFAGKDKVENLVSEWKIFRRRPNGYRSTRTDVHADGISQTYRAQEACSAPHIQSRSSASVQQSASNF